MKINVKKELSYLNDIIHLLFKNENEHKTELSYLLKSLNYI